jgi:hypothetical protein
MFSSEERDAYQAKMAAQRRQWQARLAELQAKREEAEADMRLKYQRQYREAVRERDEATRRLRRLRREAMWQGVRARLHGLAGLLRGGAGRVRKRA